MKSQTRPLVVYFHGTTKSSTAYKRQKKLMSFARKKKFSLLTVQNVWGLDTRNRDTMRAIRESLDAAAEFVSALVKAGVVRGDAVFATGFSSGGLVALCAGLLRPDIFRAVGDFDTCFSICAKDVLCKKFSTPNKF